MLITRGQTQDLKRNTHASVMCKIFFKLSVEVYRSSVQIPIMDRVLQASQQIRCSISSVSRISGSLGLGAQAILQSFRHTTHVSGESPAQDMNWAGRHP